MFGVVASKQDRDRVQVCTRQSTHPVVRVSGAGIAEDVGPGGHALAELLRESCEGLLGHAERPQTIPRECQRDPPLGAIHRGLRLGGGIDHGDQL